MTKLNMSPETPKPASPAEVKPATAPEVQPQEQKQGSQPAQAVPQK